MEILPEVYSQNIFKGMRELEVMCVAPLPPPFFFNHCYMAEYCPLTRLSLPFLCGPLYMYFCLLCL